MKHESVTAAILIVACVLVYGVGEGGDCDVPLIAGRPQSATTDNGPTGYWFDLKAGDFFRLSIQKSGTGVALSIVRPDGNVLRSYGCSHRGPVSISELASTAGRHTVRVDPCPKQNDPVAYEISLSSHRAARLPDRERVAAERLSLEAERLVSEYRADRRRAAVLQYGQALAKWRSIGACIEESRVLASIGALYRDLGDSAQAVKHADNALSSARGCGDSRNEIEALLLMASLQLNRGNAAKALENCAQALGIARANSDFKSAGEALYVRGLILYETADYIKAAQALEEAKELFCNRHDNLGFARALLYLAAVDFDLQRFDAARDKGREALLLFRSLADKRGQAMALTYLGHFQSALGKKQEAMNLYQEAGLMVTDSGDAFTEASLLNGIAAVHFEMGDTRAALQFLRLALQKNRALNDRIGIAHTLWTLGGCYYAAGDLNNALPSLIRARETFHSLSNKRMEGYVLEDIGILFDALGNRAAAMEHLDQSLRIAQSLQDRRMEAWTRTSMGFIYEAAGSNSLALETYRRALRLYEASDDRLGQMNALYRIAGLIRLHGNLEEALGLSEKALALGEELRAGITNPGLRISYFASINEQYDLCIDLLMRLYRKQGRNSTAVRAFEASERSRARALLDSIRETQVSILEGVDPFEAERHATLRSQLDSKAERYTQLRSLNADPKTISDLSDEIGRLSAEIDMSQARLREQSPRYAALVLPEPLKLDPIQNQLLDDDSLLLEYALGAENSYLWIVARNDFGGFVLPKRSEIEKKVWRLRSAITARSELAGEEDIQARVRTAEAEYRHAAAELSRILLGPVADRLESRRLILVTEGALQYLPFGALPTPQSVQSSAFTPLLVEHEIVNLPSVSTLAVIRREAPQRVRPDRTLAVFADPVFEKNDSRVRNTPSVAKTMTGGTGARVGTDANICRPVREREKGKPPSGIHLPRLLSTQLEAKAILEMVPERSCLAALGFQATKAAAMSQDLKRYRIVHFATHTILNDEHPDLSSLVLSLVDERGNPQNGYLRLSDVYNLSLSAELVVLSACETAFGKDIKGEGLISMVRGFIIPGRPVCWPAYGKWMIRQRQN